MSYTVLARKYRPQRFADLVGQEHVSRTLANAIQGGRVAHAFLFTGARGVGKTTTARLLAKCLNCEQGPTATPCNQCDPCKEIAAGIDIDVLEIDGASNNGVDDVRRLQETLPFRPARDRFKIVIVDEVHMLSTGAFNAFLKTLEEPPPHVKFVFATTEIHKVPVTIRSRCQRYDFRLIPHAIVVARVREILAAEQIVADDAAVALVAREAAGSMRDALTVLDQVLALGGPGAKGLHGDDVARGLAIASRENVLSTTEALLSGDAAECLRRVNAIAEQGLDMLHFARQLLECARDLTVLRVVGESDALVALAPDELVRAKAMAGERDRAELERLFAGLTKLVEEVGQAGLPQMTLEMGLVRLAGRPPLIAVHELIDRLRSFEEQLGGGPSGPGGSGGRAGPGSGGRGASGSGRPITRAEGGAPAPRSVRMNELEAPAPRAAVAHDSARSLTEDLAPPSPLPPPAAHAPAAPRAADAPQPSAATSAAPPSPDAPHPADDPGTFAAPPAHAAPDLAGASRPVAPAPQTAVPTRPAADVASAQPTAPDAPPPSAASAGDSLWARIVRQVKNSQPALGAVLDHGMPLEVTPKTVRIGFPDGSFFGRQAQSASARSSLLRAAESVLGATPELHIGGPGDGKLSTLAELEESGRRVRKAERREAALKHPSVVSAMEVFGESEGSVDVQVDME